VVAGTASAVAGSVSARQQARAQREPDFRGTSGQQVTTDAAAGSRADAGAATERMIAQLTQLASLRDQGVLTNDEFEVQKARLLA
jgi:putative oligomerization/nucleic acid binding protein